MSFGRLERSAVPPPMSDINMTPLIDVMLVLVVIFIITAPLLASTVQLSLPKAVSAKATEAPQFVLIALDKTGQLYWADQRIDRLELIQRLQATAQSGPDTEVQLKADAAVPYGQIVDLMGLAQQAGLNRIGFVALPDGAPAH